MTTVSPAPSELDLSPYQDPTEIQRVLCKESVDVSCHHSVDTWVEVGFGRLAEVQEEAKAVVDAALAG